MNKVALNFICKNESHIIERMLHSARPITDMIVAVDTGSTDDTIQHIQDFGKKEGLPTYVFTRPFDNFCNSRNYALEQLKVKAAEAGWDLDRSWGFTVDCDEWVRFTPAFTKSSLCADFYVVRQCIGRETFTRHGLYRLSKDIVWESPIHETLVYGDPSIVKAYAFDIEIVEEPMGASWKGDLELKFLRYAEVLKVYLEEGHATFRTIYFIGDSYNAAGTYCKDAVRAHRFFEMADQYFLKAAEITGCSPEVRFMLFKKIGENNASLGRKWPDAMASFLQAFVEYPAKAETFALIIEHYIDEGKWELAYWYSKFAYTHFVLNLSEYKRILYNDESLYQWRLLFCLYFTAYRAGRRKLANTLFKKLRNLQKIHAEWFTEEDLMLIQLHAPWVLKGQNWKAILKSLVHTVSKIIYREERNPQKSQSRAPKRIHYAA